MTEKYAYPPAILQFFVFNQLTVTIMAALNEIPGDNKSNADKISMHIEQMAHLRSKQEANESRFIEALSWIIVLGLIAAVVYMVVNFKELFT